MLTQTRHIIANLHESNIKFPSKVQDLTISHRALENVQDRVLVFICNHCTGAKTTKSFFIFLPVFQVAKRNGKLKKAFCANLHFEL